MDVKRCITPRLTWTEFILSLMAVSCKANPKDALQDCICCPEFGAKQTSQ